MFPSIDSCRAGLPARERILVTAHDLFYGEGIRATGIDKLIAESGVTKVTFYRHFPSKNDLIRSYLDHRHRLWIDWFRGALVRHGCAELGAMALLATLEEWWTDERFRGCAFINAAVEFGASSDEVLEVSRLHKEDMIKAIWSTLSPGRGRQALAQSLALAVDGAIVHVQLGMDARRVLANFEQILRATLKSIA
jgi:AcrR family transcriptional regulator